MKMKHRALAVLLGIAMVLTFMPALAFAENESISGDTYGADSNKTEADYRLGDDYEWLAGATIIVDKNQRGIFYSEEEPDGRYFGYEVKAVKVNGSDVKYDPENESWKVRIAEGSNKIEMTYYLYDFEKDELSDVTAVHTYTVTGLKYQYNVSLEPVSMDVAVPGGEIKFRAKGMREFTEEDGWLAEDYEFEYSWDKAAEDSWIESISVSAAPDNSYCIATAKIRNDIDPEILKENNLSEEIIVKLTANGETLASDTYEFEITNRYEELVMTPDIDEYMPVGDKAEFALSLIEHKYTEMGKAEEAAPIQGVKYKFEYDSSVVVIREGDETVPSNSDGLYTGPFSVERIGGDSTEIYMTPYDSSGKEMEGWVSALEEHLSFEDNDEYKIVISRITDRIYNGKAQTQNPVVEKVYLSDDGGDSSFRLSKRDDYTLEYKDNVNAGTATVEIVGLNQYKGSRLSGTFRIAKANQSPVVAVKAVKVKAKKLKKKAQKVKALTVKGAQGAVSFSGTGVNKKSKKALKINSKTGKITVKKKTKKGTYKMKVTVKAAGSRNYNAASVTKLVTIKVK